MILFFLKVLHCRRLPLIIFFFYFTLKSCNFFEGYYYYRVFYLFLTLLKLTFVKSHKNDLRNLKKNRMFLGSMRYHIYMLSEKSPYQPSLLFTMLLFLNSLKDNDYNFIYLWKHFLTKAENFGTRFSQKSYNLDKPTIVSDNKLFNLDDIF